MSADNYTKCPKCQNNKLNATRSMKEAYGKVPAEEYEALSKAAHRKLETTFREDWEIGVLDGEFYVHYRGVCSECTFSFRYEVENHPVLSKGAL